MPQRVRECTKPDGNNASYPPRIERGSPHAHPQGVAGHRAGQPSPALRQVGGDCSASRFANGNITLLAALAVDADEGAIGDGFTGEGGDLADPQAAAIQQFKQRPVAKGDGIAAFHLVERAADRTCRQDPRQ
jgi:hypothetical protein